MGTCILPQQTVQVANHSILIAGAQNLMAGACVAMQVVLQAEAAGLASKQPGKETASCTSRDDEPRKATVPTLSDAFHATATVVPALHQTRLQMMTLLSF